MTDLEMTKLCAEAINLRINLHGNKVYDVWASDTGEGLYDPLHDDAQAMALVKKLGLTVDPQEDKPPFTWRVVVANDGDWDDQIFSQGSYLNHAIVECVAKMQAARTK